MELGIWELKDSKTKGRPSITNFHARVFEDAWDRDESCVPYDEYCPERPRSHEAQARDKAGSSECVAIPLG